MYDTTDPRSTLAAAKPTAQPVEAKPYGRASYIHFKAGPPQIDDGLSKQWFGRGQNFVIAYIEAQAGAKIERVAQPDEYLILSPQHTTELRVTSDHGAEEIPGYSLVMVPAGRSLVEVKTAGHFFMLVSARSDDATQLAVNAEAYAESHHHVAPLVPWPEPADGPKIRRYSLDVADEPGRFGRIWRCTTFMVNVMPENGPRDIEKMSPHHHDDFEQCSLLVSGTMTHHLRWPWTTNMRHWLPDDHVDCGSPSMAVIPPPAIHTSNGTGTQPRLLVDVFCPPRMDLSQKPGWVLNANEYPTPHA